MRNFQGKAFEEDAKDAGSRREKSRAGKSLPM